jgi:hypothetical protein
LSQMFREIPEYKDLIAGVATLPVWVLGTPAKRWTAAGSLRGSIPLSSARPSNQFEPIKAEWPEFRIDMGSATP